MAGSLQVLISAIERNYGNIQELAELLDRNAELLSKNIGAFNTFVDRFGDKQWTCIRAAALRAKVSGSQYLENTVIEQVSEFFHKCDPPKLKEIKPIVRGLAEQLTSKLIAQSHAIIGIPILLQAIIKMRDSPEHLTSLHGFLCQLGLSARCFNPLLPVLDTDILDVDSDKNAFEIRDCLLYFYYGGMIYGALKKWDRSLHFFSLALMLPSKDCYSIIVEAAKKFILVSLILHGKVNTSEHAVFRVWKVECEVYRKLINAFSANDPTVLTKCIEKHANLFRSDTNYGLVKQLVDRHVKFRIKNLTKTFVALSLTDLAARVHLRSADEAELHLRQMAASGSIFVQIDQEDGTVRFLQNPEQYDSPEMLQTIIEKMDAVMVIEKKLNQMTGTMVLNEGTLVDPKPSRNMPTPVTKRKMPME